MLSAETRSPLGLPAWPFLIANHEVGRVDYRAIVAPDFLCEQQCSQVLAGLPFPEESLLPCRCTLTYQGKGRSQYRALAIFRLLEFSSAGGQGCCVQVLSGLLLATDDQTVSVSYSALERAFTLYADDYRRFCDDTAPAATPVVASWPLSIERVTAEPATLLPSCDATRLRPRPITVRAAQRRDEEAYPITRREALRLLEGDSVLSRLKGLLRVQ